MAKRSPKKTKASSPRKPRGRAGADGGFEVTEDSGDVAAKQALGIESGLIIVTFIALALALVLIELELSASFGEFWPLG